MAYENDTDDKSAMGRQDREGPWWMAESLPGIEPGERRRRTRRVEKETSTIRHSQTASASGAQSAERSEVGRTGKASA